MNDPSKTTMHVSVFDGSHFVEDRSCRVTRTPQDEPAVLYRGLAHPLLEGTRIDLNGPAYVPDANPSDTTISRGPRVLCVNGDRTGYVLIEGSVVDREAAMAAVRTAGAVTHRAGRYLGDPLDDFTADWFVRFDLGSSTFNEIERAVANLVTSAPPVDSPADELRLQLLAIELAEARARIATLETENARLRVERAEELAQGDEIDPDAAARLEAERAALFEALNRETRAREAAEALAETARGNAVPAVPGAKALRAEIECVVKALMPRIRFVRESILVVAVEYRERGALYRALSQLDATSGMLPSGWKKLKGLDDWWERHVSDGASDAGRLYARRNPTANVYDVLASTKHEQVKDIAWLRKR